MPDHTFPTPEIVHREAQQLLVVRDTITMREIPAFFDRAYPLLFTALDRASLAPTGPALSVTHGEPGATLDISAALPVAGSSAAEIAVADDPAENMAGGPDERGEVRAEALPAGRAATFLVRGSYSLLGPAFGRLFDWIAASGLVSADLTWEEYLAKPEPGGDPALNETRIYALLQPEALRR